MLLGSGGVPLLEAGDWQCRGTGKGCGDREEGEDSEEEASSELEHGYRGLKGDSTRSLKLEELRMLENREGKR